MEPVEPVLKNIYQSNNYRKDLSGPHFKDEQGLKRSSNRTSVIRLVKWNQPSFPSTEIYKPLFAPVHSVSVSCISDLSSEANWSCCHRSCAWSHLQYTAFATWKLLQVLQKACTKIMACAIYTYQTCNLIFCWKIKRLLWPLFSLEN